MALTQKSLRAPVLADFRATTQDAIVITLYASNTSIYDVFVFGGKVVSHTDGWSIQSPRHEAA